MSKLCSELHMPVKKTKSCKTAKVCRALKNDVVNCEQYIFKIHFHTCGHHISQVELFSHIGIFLFKRSPMSGVITTSTNFCYKQ